MPLHLILVAVVLAALVGIGAGAALAHRHSTPKFARYLRRHFGPISVSSLTVTERDFPARVRVDLQQTLDRFLAENARVNEVLGVAMNDSSMFGMSLSALLTYDTTSGAVPLQYDEIGIGEAAPVRCLGNALWLLTVGSNKYAVLLSKVFNFQAPPKVRIDVAAPHNDQGTAFSKQLFEALETAVKQARSYRGRVLSMESTEEYTGQATGIKVHKLPPVQREDVVLPESTLKLLERNVVQFVAQRNMLVELGQSGRKGLLFFGPPGNGKTHTIHYLINELAGHTTILISSEQMGDLGEYMSLARLLQPSIVIIEDVDLIARDRHDLGSACQESLLNKLLNEMDGLKGDAEILFVLTTNRPEALEAALASRPGRVDQAIEFPAPDETGRRKLVRLYSRAVEIPEAVVSGIVERTEGASAAFIKELMRRALQCHLAHSTTRTIEFEDVENALEELLASSAWLNRRAIGFGEQGANGGASGAADRKPAPLHVPRA
ncbi:MAG: AAA family ATPase [Pirellulales bacterium]